MAGICGNEHRQLAGMGPDRRVVKTEARGWSEKRRASPPAERVQRYNCGKRTQRDSAKPANDLGGVFAPYAPQASSLFFLLLSLGPGCGCGQKGGVVAHRLFSVAGVWLGLVIPGLCLEISTLVAKESRSFGR